MFKNCLIKSIVRQTTTRLAWIRYIYFLNHSISIWNLQYHSFSRIAPRHVSSHWFLMSNIPVARTLTNLHVIAGLACDDKSHNRNGAFIRMLLQQFPKRIFLFHQWSRESSCCDTLSVIWCSSYCCCRRQVSISRVWEFLFLFRFEILMRRTLNSSIDYHIRFRTNEKGQHFCGKVGISHRI